MGTTSPLSLRYRNLYLYMCVNSLLTLCCFCIYEMSIATSRVLLSEYSLPIAYIILALILILESKRHAGTTTRLLLSNYLSCLILPSTNISCLESFFKTNYWAAAISYSVVASGNCNWKALVIFLETSVSWEIDSLSNVCKLSEQMPSGGQAGSEYGNILLISANLKWPIKGSFLEPSSSALSSFFYFGLGIP